VARLQLSCDITGARDASPSPRIASLRDTQEELLLLKHYSENIAPWMDLLYRYEVFSREVLTLARDHAILRYAACAVAAKQLAQKRPCSRGSNNLGSGTTARVAERINEGGLGFAWYSAKYYEKAIQTLMRSITPRDHHHEHHHCHHSSGSNDDNDNDNRTSACLLSEGDLMVRADREDPIVRLLGTCILIQYEHLSASREAWSGHLTGFSKLLDLIDGGQLLRPNLAYEQVYPFTKSIMEVKAGFWNFVVNDMEESCEYPCVPYISNPNHSHVVQSTADTLHLPRKSSLRDEHV
jgi:hypothetical protein